MAAKRVGLLAFEAAIYSAVAAVFVWVWIL